MAKSYPTVSVVIPTRYRPNVLCQAIRSVTAQTVPVLECIVVIDGPDLETVTVLQGIDFPALKIVALEENVGGSEARNIGARAAQGEWIGYLDDDDEWLPEKLERQLALLEGIEHPPQVLFSRYLDSGTNEDLLRPRRFPRAQEAMSDYLMCDLSFFGGFEGCPQTSTWLICRDLLLHVPFTLGLKAFQDIDWLLHAFADPAVYSLSAEEPLAIFHNEKTSARVSLKVDQQFCYEWGQENREFFSPKAYGYYLVVFCLNRAVIEGKGWKLRFRLLREAGRVAQWPFKLVFLSGLYLFVYPILRRIISPRKLKVVMHSLVQHLRSSS
jgi:glycosyltransferase involved in cell wall biosynthesis